MNELQIVFFNNKTRETGPVEEGSLQSRLEKTDDFFWIDINNPDSTVLSEFMASMDINAVWTDHFESPEILPHLHETPMTFSFYLYDIENVESLGDTSHDLKEFTHVPLLVIYGKRFVITYHQQKLDLIQYIRETYEYNFKNVGQTPGFIAFLLFQHCLYSYSRLNLMNDNFLDELEFGVITGNPSENIPMITSAGYNILTLKKLNANLHIILLMLVSKESLVVSELARVSFANLMKETVSIRESIDSSRYLVDSIIASIQAESSHKTSEIMRLLTIISCIFTPLTLITGIFGMNFVEIPGLQWKYGFTVCIIVMFSVITTSVMMLRRLGWIGDLKRKLELR